MNLVASASVASSAIPSVAIAVVSIPMAGLEGELIPGRDATLVPCSGARVEMRAAENHDPSKSKKPAHNCLDWPQQDISRRRQTEGKGGKSADAMAVDQPNRQCRLHAEGIARHDR